MRVDNEGQHLLKDIALKSTINLYTLYTFFFITVKFVGLFESLTLFFHSTFLQLISLLIGKIAINYSEKRLDKIIDVKKLMVDFYLNFLFVCLSVGKLTCVYAQ